MPPFGTYPDCHGAQAAIPLTPTTDECSDALATAFNITSAAPLLSAAQSMQSLHTVCQAAESEVRLRSLIPDPLCSGCIVQDPLCNPLGRAVLWLFNAGERCCLQPFTAFVRLCWRVCMWAFIVAIAVVQLHACMCM